MWIGDVIVARDIISLGMLQAENVAKPEIEKILKFVLEGLLGQSFSQDPMIC